MESLKVQGRSYIFYLFLIFMSLYVSFKRVIIYDIQKIISDVINVDMFAKHAVKALIAEDIKYIILLHLFFVFFVLMVQYFIDKNNSKNYDFYYIHILDSLRNAILIGFSILLLYNFCTNMQIDYFINKNNNLNEYINNISINYNSLTSFKSDIERDYQNRIKNTKNLEYNSEKFLDEYKIIKEQFESKDLVAISKNNLDTYNLLKNTAQEIKDIYVIYKITINNK